VDDSDINIHSINLYLISDEKSKKIAAWRRSGLLYISNNFNILLNLQTSILFDVGWTGSLALGRLMARQINFELEESGAFLVDWTPDRVD
jgi:hypothetical protein